MATRLHLESPLPRRECADRLRAAILQSHYGGPTVDGRVTDESVTLWKVISFRNSFQSFLRGKWQALPDGTAFRGSVGLHPLAKIFLAVWSCFTGLMGVGMWASVLQVWASGVAHPDPRHVSNGGPLLLLSPLGIWLVPALLVWFGRWVARREDALLVTFLTEAIRGRPAASLPQSSLGPPR